ncbi:MAG: tetratricopeptide repeat protein [Candidatus Riflebacteria bacterium]|nr:tetratricopeptide repeat protein [Candidatus Riflebacteria bacterium]
MRLTRISIVLLCMVLFAQVVSANQMLIDARRLCDQGSFQQALDIFMAVHKQGGTPEELKEARYFIGFCKVRLQDYWGAISAYEAFLNQYENAQLADGIRFIPDAMFVLARTHEQVNQVPQALEIYRRCIAKFPGNDFANKSRERLNLLSNSAQVIEDIIRMAKAAPTYAQQDQILIDGLSRATNGRDVMRLAQAAGTNQGTDHICKAGARLCLNADEAINLAKVTATYAAQDEVCIICINVCANGNDVARLAKAAGTTAGTDRVCISGVVRCQSVNEVIAVAKATGSYAAQDQVLLAGVRWIRTYNDATLLANAASSYATTQRILDEARKILGGTPNYSMNTMGIQMSVKTADKSEGKTEKGKTGNKPVVKANTVDPFENHKVDKDKISRVERFLDSVKKMSKVDESRSSLKPADLSLEVIKDAMKDFNKKKSFGKAHTF